ncbi:MULTISPECIES: BON domain-containing protein [unclassified Pigmentiphaga]|uniref:BON domain-containing protein n=1 Tax=unclassified Pigmentiphaga TaxID=2626614 RepID=UPI001A9D42A0|nr:MULTISPECIES: BON domain-containing protein [unclassified Pigmentiphaga]
MTMPQLLAILPLVLILVLLLPPFRFHFLLAGLIGGIAAVLIGKLPAAAISKLFLDGMGQIMTIYSVMLFAATAMVLARCGCTKAVMDLIRGWFGERLEYVAAAMVLVQGAASYMAGNGAANTLVTAPLVVRRRIEDALKRNAQIEANGITVKVNDNKVTLEGKVRSWLERSAVENAAWSAPGIAQVDDRLVVN